MHPHLCDVTLISLWACFICRAHRSGHRGYRLSARYDSQRRNATSGLSRGDVCIDVRQIYRLPREPSRSFERCHYTRHVFRIGSLDVTGSHPVIYQGVAADNRVTCQHKAPRPIVSTVRNPRESYSVTDC